MAEPPRRPLIRAGQSLLGARPGGVAVAGALVQGNGGWGGHSAQPQSESQARALADLRAHVLSWHVQDGALRGPPAGARLEPLPPSFGKLDEYVNAFSEPFFAELFEDLAQRLASAAGLVGVACEIGSADCGSRFDGERVLRLRADRHSVGSRPASGRPDRDAAADSSFGVHDLLLLTPCHEPDADGGRRAEPAPPDAARRVEPAAATPADEARAAAEARMRGWVAPAPEPAAVDAIAARGARAADARARAPPARAEGAREEGELDDDADEPAAQPVDPRIKRRRPNAAAAAPAPISRAASPPPPPARAAARYALGIVTARAAGARDGFVSVAIADSAVGRALLAPFEAQGASFRLRALPFRGALATATREYVALREVGKCPLLHDTLLHTHAPSAQQAPQQQAEAEAAPGTRALLLPAARPKPADSRPHCVEVPGDEAAAAADARAADGGGGAAGAAGAVARRAVPIPLCSSGAAAALPDPRSRGARPCPPAAPAAPAAAPTAAPRPAAPAPPRAQPAAQPCGARYGALDGKTAHHLALLRETCRLNASQAEALRAAAHLSRGACLIVGPPGSGKSTVTLALLNLLHAAAYRAYHDRLLERALLPDFLGAAALLPDGPPGAHQLHARAAKAGGAPLPAGTTAAALAACAERAALAAAAAAEAASDALSERLEADYPRLLVCAPSNVAVDELLVRAMDGAHFVDGAGGRYRPDVLRLGDGSKAERAQQVSVEARTAQWLDALERSPETAASELARVQASVQTAARELRECVATVRAHWRGCGAHAAAPDWALHRDTHRQQLTARWENLRRARKWQRAWRIGLDANQSREARRMQLRELELGAAQIVFATLAAAGSDALVKARRHFQTVVIDEACQATEPAVVVALQYGARKLLLVGDPRQLPATVLSREAERAGYGRSLFERLLLCGARPLLLAEQHRMHPAIAHFPARHFYNGALQSAEAVDPHVRAAPAALERLRRADCLPRPLGPYCVFDVARGREQRAGARGLSTRNAAEADACAELVGRLLAAAAACPGASRARPLGGATVAILSPYQAQLDAVRQAVGKHPLVRRAGVAAADLVEISTVDGFQGREKDCVIFTAVRAPPSGGIGFVADVRRMNVGLTRARHAMWIVGHAQTLADASDDWAALVADARARNVLHPWPSDGD